RATAGPRARPDRHHPSRDAPCPGRRAPSRGRFRQSRELLARRHLLGPGEVEVVEALAAVGVGAAVLVPVDREPRPEDAGGYERPDVEADTVVKVWLPTDRLFSQRLPADVDVEWRLAINDLLQLALEFERGDEAGLDCRFLPSALLPL